MKVSWLHDDPGYVGGAELTMFEFAQAAPDSVTLEYVGPNDPIDGDVVVIGNCVTYDAAICDSLMGRRLIRYHHDLAWHEPLELASFLVDYAEHIFTSPLHVERYGWNTDYKLIPPAIDLARFQFRSGRERVRAFSGEPDIPDVGEYLRTAELPFSIHDGDGNLLTTITNREERRRGIRAFRGLQIGEAYSGEAERAKVMNGERKGAVCIGAFQNPGKGAELLSAWARENGGLDVYGFGPFGPPQSEHVTHKGELEPLQVPAALWNYETFVHLPRAVEPFGRCVVEAWAAGCSVITNKLVGSRYWIEEKPEALETAATDFWEVVLDA